MESLIKTPSNSKLLTIVVAQSVGSLSGLEMVLFVSSCVGMLLFFTLHAVCSARCAITRTDSVAHAVIAFIFPFPASYDIAFAPLIRPTASVPMASLYPVFFFHFPRRHLQPVRQSGRSSRNRLEVPHKSPFACLTDERVFHVPYHRSCTAAGSHSTRSSVLYSSSKPRTAAWKILRLGSTARRPLAKFALALGLPRTRGTSRSLSLGDSPQQNQLIRISSRQLPGRSCRFALVFRHPTSSYSTENSQCTYLSCLMIHT